MGNFSNDNEDAVDEAAVGSAVIFPLLLASLVSAADGDEAAVDRKLTNPLLLESLGSIASAPPLADRFSFDRFGLQKQFPIFACIA